MCHLTTQGKTAKEIQNLVYIFLNLNSVKVKPHLSRIEYDKPQVAQILQRHFLLFLFFCICMYIFVIT